ncbi:MAG TPA: RluA family pseudouridine synthase [Chloroflexota bacterium]|jgi:23S rRNA pseudouridine1911/1915/1917 synthase
MPAVGRPDIHRVAPWGEGQRLDAYLSRFLSERSRAQWQRLIETGIVTLNGLATRPSARLSPHDRLEIRPVAPAALLEPDPSILLDIVYEDPALVVINKPPGLVVHPAPGHQDGTLVHALLARFPALHDPSGQQRPGIIHRLDKDTSGLMVVGKTPEAVADVQGQMKLGQVEKHYLLLVTGEVPDDRAVIEVPIGRDRQHRQKMAARTDGRASRTEFRVLERFRGYTLVKADLASGRTHQLRVHFAYIRHPVAGDSVYGSGRGPEGLRRQFVHSAELSLTSPATGERLNLFCDLASDLAQVVANLGRQEPNLVPHLITPPQGENEPSGRW